MGCLGGISALTGLALDVIGDWSPFSGSSIGAYTGLVPSKYSSSTSRVQGSITKAVDTHVRRLLIEAAWHHIKSYNTSVPNLRARWAKVDPALRARSHAGNRRLYRRWQGFTERKEAPLGGQRGGRTRVVGLVLVAGHHVTRRAQRTWLARQGEILAR